ncbi:hypothetical protein CR162_06950 [Pseudoroseomonas rhizosphaerae]|uniref:Uncharacterized protein n=1 Tax=Teichococcus rhizosphaerae TaxID=1335062 RepID=A0A2C7AFW8_9PROT|nr:hypothetical protein [Pseudoroseomonas rhizosphaerae]PHK95587.1 hypothetical protein CR162_06950 [Pseudoroseomonas rhizosphaerae]
MSLLTREDLRHHSALAWACLVLLAGTGIGLWLLGRQGAALGTAAALLGCLGLILPPRERMPVLPRRLRALPRWLDATPVLATLLSTPGYGLGWFYRPGPYDEVVHLVNGVLAGAVFIAMLRADGRCRPARRLVWSVAAFGLALAAGWELFEWATGLIGDRLDTVTDVALTALGTVLAAAWAVWRETPASRDTRLPGPCR